MATEEQSRWATRVLIDRERETVIIFRDVVYGLEPQEVLEGDARLVLDEAELHQVTPLEMELSVGDMQVRLMLQRFGPREFDKTRPKSATEIVVWINGKSRVVGYLEGSWHQECGVPIWDRISIWRKGAVVVGSAVTGEYPIIRRGHTNGYLGTEDGWMIEPADAFPSSEELDRYIESLDDDDDGGKQTAKSAATGGRAVVATRDSLPFQSAPTARR
jgi:hypothetical protein